MTIQEMMRLFVRVGIAYREQHNITKTEHAARMYMKKHHLDKVEEFDENIKFSVLMNYATFHDFKFEVYQ